MDARELKNLKRLLKSVKLGDVDMFKDYLRFCLDDLNYIYDDSKEPTILCKACAKGNYLFVKVLLGARNININLGNPILAAYSRGYLDIVLLLLKQRPKIDGEGEEFDQIRRWTVINKYQHDQDVGGITAFKGLLSVKAPNFFKHVVSNNKLIESLEAQELAVLQMIIDNLIYGKEFQSTANEAIIALSFLESFMGEGVKLKKRMLFNIRKELELKNVFDQIEQVECMIEKSKKMCFETNPLYLKPLKEFLLNFISVNSAEQEFDDYIITDKRFDKYSREIVKKSKENVLDNICFPEETPVQYSVAELFESQLFADVELIVNGKAVKCHKTILCKCAYFEAMFNSSNWNSNENYPEEMIYIIKYCYTILDDEIPQHLLLPLIKKALEFKLCGFLQFISLLLEIDNNNFIEIANTLKPYLDDESFSVVRRKLTAFAYVNTDFISKNLNEVPENVKNGIIVLLSKRGKRLIEFELEENNQKKAKSSKPVSPNYNWYKPPYYPPHGQSSPPSTPPYYQPYCPSSPVTEFVCPHQSNQFWFLETPYSPPSDLSP